MEEYLELKPKQKEAWKNLQKAFRECDKAGILIVNDYGSLIPLDKTLVIGMGDSIGVYDTTNTVPYEGSAYSFVPKSRLVSWADDSHHLVLTEKGMNILNKEKQDE